MLPTNTNNRFDLDFRIWRCDRFVQSGTIRLYTFSTKRLLQTSEKAVAEKKK